MASLNFFHFGQRFVFKMIALVNLYLATGLRKTCLIVFSVLVFSGCSANQDANQLIDIKRGKSAIIDVGSQSIRELPAGFFGYTLESLEFEMTSLKSGENKVKQDVIRNYALTPHSIFRYPGGLVANHFNWEESRGNVKTRPPQKLTGWATPSPVMFGVDEYFQFLDEVKGIPWYTLNLNGWSESKLNAELPSSIMAASNKKLATYIVSKTPNAGVRYYQLGNELDRSIYEWPIQKYIERSLDTMRVVSAVDPNARFIAFVRDFDYKYKKRSGKGTSKDLMRSVFKAMPAVDDISFQFYYDTPHIAKPESDIPWRLGLFNRAIKEATELRNGRPPRVWITEHGRSRHPDIKGSQANSFTAGLGGAISAADFWIAIAQMPAIEGAFLYSVGQWNIFQNLGDSAYPLPMYWAVRVLRSLDLPIVLSTTNASPNYSAYAGGYDIRTVAFTDVGRTRYGLWAVNRAKRDLPASIKIPALAGKKLEVTHNYLAGRQGVDADADKEPPRVILDQPPQTVLVGEDGVVVLNLPANSVSSFNFVLGERRVKP